jgi:hypothetical protein
VDSKDREEVESGVEQEGSLRFEFELILLIGWFLDLLPDQFPVRTGSPVDRRSVGAEQFPSPAPHEPALGLVLASVCHRGIVLDSASLEWVASLVHLTPGSHRTHIGAELSPPEMTSGGHLCLLTLPDAVVLVPLFFQLSVYWDDKCK